MSLKALFYVNGSLELATAAATYYAPHIFTGGLKVDNAGAMYARRFSMMLGSFSIGSILIAKQPDSQAKIVFSLGWLLYHTGVCVDRALRDRKLQAVFIHGAMAVAFAYYIYKSDINKSTFMVWRIKNLKRKQ
eukprot:889414_1